MYHIITPRSTKSSLAPLVSPPKTLHSFLLSPIRATCPAHADMQYVHLSQRWTWGDTPCRWVSTDVSENLVTVSSASSGVRISFCLDLLTLKMKAAWFSETSGTTRSNAWRHTSEDVRLFKEMLVVPDTKSSFDCLYHMQSWWLAPRREPRCNNSAFALAYPPLPREVSN